MRRIAAMIGRGSLAVLVIAMTACLRPVSEPDAGAGGGGGAMSGAGGAGGAATGGGAMGGGGTGGGATGGGGVVGPPCDLFAQDCDAGACYPQGFCQPVGPNGEGSPCEQHSDCGAGLACLSMATGRFCERMCNSFGGGGSMGCGAGQTCMPTMQLLGGYCDPAPIYSVFSFVDDTLTPFVDICRFDPATGREVYVAIYAYAAPSGLMCFPDSWGFVEAMTGIVDGGPLPCPYIYGPPMQSTTDPNDAMGQVFIDGGGGPVIVSIYATFRFDGGETYSFAAENVRR